MTGALERRYRRLLRIYPSTWRADNEEVVLGTLLDVAESDGRERPARGERWTLVVDGLGHRLDRRAGLWAAVIAFAASAAGGIGFLFVGVELSGIGLGWLTSALLLVVVPIGLVVSSAALLRSIHRIGSRAALGAVVLGVPAAGAASAAATLWSVGFEAADAGRPVSSGETTAMLVYLVAAWILGAAVLGLLARPLFSGGALARIGGVIAAVIAAPILGYALLSPLTGIALAAVAVVLALAVKGERDPRRSRAGVMPGVAPVPVPVPVSAASAPPESWVLPSLIGAAVVGVVAVAISLSGSLWIAGLDGTEAMNVGLGIGSVTAAVTVGIAAVRLVWTGALGRIGAVAAIIAPVATGVGQLAAGLRGSDPWVAWLLGSALAGAALAFLVGRAVRRRYPDRGRSVAVAVGLLAGVGYAATAGIMVTAYLPFIAPILAAVAAWSLWRGRAPRARHAGVAVG